MLFDANTTPDSSTQNAMLYDARPPAIELAHSDLKLPDDYFERWELKTRWLALEGGEVSVKLKKPAVVMVSFEKDALEVVGWGLEVKISESNRIDRSLARRLLFLAHRAELGVLSPAEKRQWLHVVDNCDLSEFFLEREQPQYFEGRLISRNKDCRIQWHDGKVSVVSKKVASRLNLVNEGEDFSCLAKFDVTGKARQIERVSPIPPPEVRIKEEWPKKFSESTSET